MILPRPRAKTPTLGDTKFTILLKGFIVFLIMQSCSASSIKEVAIVIKLTVNVPFTHKRHHTPFKKYWSCIFQEV